MDENQPKVPYVLPKGGIKEVITTKAPLDESSRKWQLSPLDTIEEIRQRLKGNYYNESKAQWVYACEPWMNDEGIGRLSSIINFYVNKNVQLSYFEPEIIENMTIQFSFALSEFLRFHYAQYGVRKEHVDIVANMITDFVYAALQRARFGKESQFIENTEQRHITTMEGQQQGSGGMMSKIPILGGRFK